MNDGPVTQLPQRSLRDELRTAIFSAKSKRREIVEMFGVTVEVRQPSFGAILDMRDQENERHRIAHILINYCYVPNTDERLFEDGDVPDILNLPAGQEIRDLNEAVARLTGVDLADAEEELGKT